MSDVLIVADTRSSPEMRHEVPLVVPDPFLYAEKDGVKHYSTEVVMGPNDTLRFVQVKGAKDDEVGSAADTDDEIPF